MINSENVLKSILKNTNPKGNCVHTKVMSELNIDSETLVHFLNILSEKDYITYTLENSTLTSLGYSACEELKFHKKFYKKSKEFVKLILKKIIDIIIG